MLWYKLDRPKITIHCTTDTGALVDPDVLTVSIKTPSKVTSTLVFGVDPGLIRDAQGVYHFYITLTESGNWHYRAVGTGSRPVAKEGTVFCQPSEF